MNMKRRITAFLMALTMILGFAAGTPAQIYAAQPVRTIKQSIKPIGDGKDCKLWVRDTITYKVQNGKIVSKPKVSSETSTANKLLGITISTTYYKVKEPTISYTKGRKTATVKTYWGCKQQVGIWKFKVTYGKTCTVTYTLNGNGKITYTKKASGLKLM